MSSSSSTSSSSAASASTSTLGTETCRLPIADDSLAARCHKNVDQFQPSAEAEQSELIVYARDTMEEILGWYGLQTPSTPTMTSTPSSKSTGVDTARPVEAEEVKYSALTSGTGWNESLSSSKLGTPTSGRRSTSDANCEELPLDLTATSSSSTAVTLSPASGYNVCKREVKPTLSLAVSPSGVHQQNNKKLIGIRYLFPAFDERTSLLERARVWVARHDHKYFVDWTEDQLKTVSAALRPYAPITRELYKLHMNRSEYCRNVKLKYCLMDDAPWAQAFRDKLATSPSEGGFTGLCQAKIAAAELWRKYSENYRSHQARHSQPGASAARRLQQQQQRHLPDAECHDQRVRHHVLDHRSLGLRQHEQQGTIEDSGRLSELKNFAHDESSTADNSSGTETTSKGNGNATISSMLDSVKMELTEDGDVDTNRQPDRADVESKSVNVARVIKVEETVGNTSYSCRKPEINAADVENDASRLTAEKNGLSSPRDTRKDLILSPKMPIGGVASSFGDEKNNNYVVRVGLTPETQLDDAPVRPEITPHICVRDDENSVTYQSSIAESVASERLSLTDPESGFLRADDNPAQAITFGPTKVRLAEDEDLKPPPAKIPKKASVNKALKSSTAADGSPASGQSSPSADYRRSERGLSFLFPSFADHHGMSLIDKVRVTVARHKNNYFLGWSEDQLRELDPIVRPRVPVTPTIYREYCHRNAMKYDSNLQFACESPEPWAVEFRRRLTLSPSEGGFTSLCEVKLEAGRLWREHSGRYRMHNIVKWQMGINSATLGSTSPATGGQGAGSAGKPVTVQSMSTGLSGLPRSAGLSKRTRRAQSTATSPQQQLSMSSTSPLSQTGPDRLPAPDVGGGIETVLDLSRVASASTSSSASGSVKSESVVGGNRKRRTTNSTGPRMTNCDERQCDLSDVEEVQDRSFGERNYHENNGPLDMSAKSGVAEDNCNRLLGNFSSPSAYGNFAATGNGFVPFLGAMRPPLAPSGPVPFPFFGFDPRSYGFLLPQPPSLPGTMAGCFDPARLMSPTGGLVTASGGQFPMPCRPGPMIPWAPGPVGPTTHADLTLMLSEQLRLQQQHPSAASAAFVDALLMQAKLEAAAASMIGGLSTSAAAAAAAKTFQSPRNGETVGELHQAGNSESYAGRTNSSSADKKQREAHNRGQRWDSVAGDDGESIAESDNRNRVVSESWPEGSTVVSDDTSCRSAGADSPVDFDSRSSSRQQLSPEEDSRNDSVPTGHAVERESAEERDDSDDENLVSRSSIVSMLRSARDDILQSINDSDGDTPTVGGASVQGDSRKKLVKTLKSAFRSGTVAPTGDSSATVVDLVLSFIERRIAKADNLNLDHPHEQQQHVTEGDPKMAKVNAC